MHPQLAGYRAVLNSRQRIPTYLHVTMQQEERIID
jgi:hypothetical protein